MAGVLGRYAEKMATAKGGSVRALQFAARTVSIAMNIRRG